MEDGYYVATLEGLNFQCVVIRGKLEYANGHPPGSLNMNRIWPKLAKFEGRWQSAKVVAESQPYVGSEQPFIVFTTEPVDDSDQSGDHQAQITGFEEILEPAELTFQKDAYDPYAVLDSEPARPNEDDMIENPKCKGCLTLGTACGKCSKCSEQLKNMSEEKVPPPVHKTYHQHPQFRDIGIRIDRYGKMVFKPELVKGGE